MLKRIIPLVAVLSLLVAIFVVPASAKTDNGITVIDYNEYVSNVEVDGDNDIVTVSLPPYLYGYQTDDSNGKHFTQGVPLGQLVSNNGKAVTAGLYFPGAGVTKTYLDITNIPDGSIISTSGKVWLETNTLGSGTFEGQYYTNIHYYDANFTLLDTKTSPIWPIGEPNGAYVYELKWDFVMEKPDNAVYCITSFRFRIQGFYNGASADNVFWFDFDFPKLKMSINSLYRLQEQTGKTNKLLDQIVNGEVTPETPNGAGSVGDLEDVEDALKDDTAAGRDEADQIFNESSDLVASHMAGFLFLSNVIERFIGVGWLRGVLTVSLSLGILGFLANIAMYAARNGRDAKGSKSSKGG